MSLFSFMFKENKSDYQSNGEKLDKKPCITGTTRNYSTINTNDVSLKVFLPEVTKIALQEMCNYTDSTISDLIRQTIFTYLYGRYDLMASIEKGKHDFSLNITELYSELYSSVSYQSDNNLIELGKNMYSAKVWISNQMKQDLKMLAEKVNISLSEFTREIIISNLFGHTFFPERNELVLLSIEFD